MPSNLELGIAAILDLVIITILTLTIVYWRTPCASQTRWACLQRICSSVKITAFALPIVAPVASTAIVAVISLERQSICKILYNCWVNFCLKRRRTSRWKRKVSDDSLYTRLFWQQFWRKGDYKKGLHVISLLCNLLSAVAAIRIGLKLNCWF